MGSGVSSANDSQAAANNVIEKQIEAERKNNQFHAEVKLLLLGSAECGKSTIFKQIKIIHLEGFTQEEALSFAPALRANLLEGVSLMVRFCDQALLTIDPSLEHIAQAHRVGVELTEAVAADIVRLAADPAMQEALRRGSEYHLFDQMSYFLQRAVVMSNAWYVPDQDDLLRVRVRTTGVREITFKNSDGHPFRLVDVGGQRSERRKWIGQFDNVTALFFVSSLADYNRTLAEDESTNALKESLKLFAEIMNSPYFANTNAILFLNKCDLFRTKIEQDADLSVCFKTYTEGRDYQKAVSYVQRRFLASAKKAPSDATSSAVPRRIYPHVTTATSTTNIRHVFLCAQDVILRTSLGVGLGLGAV